MATTDGTDFLEHFRYYEGSVCFVATFGKPWFTEPKIFSKWPNYAKLR
jgi:hypothetical protein